MPSELIQQANYFIMRNNGKRAGAKRIQNVRLVDQYAGSDSSYIERVIGQLQNSHSQVRVLVNLDQYASSAAAGDTSFLVSGSKIRGADEFVSLAAQFETFRITGIQFDVYDLTPSVNLAVAYSTYHAQSAVTPTFNFEQVVDGPDSQLIPSGVGKVSFFWRAKGTLENNFQGLLGSDPTPADFGGLRFLIPQTTTDNLKRVFIVTKAIVDFRGRY